MGFYTEIEELFHSVTHGAGAILAAVGAAYLLHQAASDGDPWRIASFAIYGATLVLLYAASTFYHGVTTHDLKARLRVLDHSAIYLLIAGTYTPFLLLPLRGVWGWSMFAIIWGLALGGIAYKLNFLDRYPRLSTILYLAMSWVALLGIIPLIERLSPVTLAWLIGGGIVYTSGTLIYHLNRIPYAHTVWHLFVLGGSICHYVAIAQL